MPRRPPNRARDAELEQEHELFSVIKEVEILSIYCVYNYLYHQICTIQGGDKFRIFGSPLLVKIGMCLGQCVVIRFMATVKRFPSWILIGLTVFNFILRMVSLFTDFETYLYLMADRENSLLYLRYIGLLCFLFYFKFSVETFIKVMRYLMQRRHMY
ncbi:hypothetical protein CRE_11137 [Caenorhabditis remanei]|uniref:Uncharacterized protein n=1 Tax=Caenorhabditis remanei TaxID=31234 RepID=E3M5S8_CAERE|nr:hypothetical protein CRE_11137 [Caenorhabditis remanei]